MHRCFFKFGLIFALALVGCMESYNRDNPLDPLAGNYKAQQSSSSLSSVGGSLSSSIPVSSNALSSLSSSSAPSSSNLSSSAGGLSSSSAASSSSSINLGSQVWKITAVEISDWGTISSVTTQSSIALLWPTSDFDHYKGTSVVLDRSGVCTGACPTDTNLVYGKQLRNTDRISMKFKISAWGPAPSWEEAEAGLEIYPAFNSSIAIEEVVSKKAYGAGFTTNRTLVVKVQCSAGETITTALIAPGTAVDYNGYFTVGTGRPLASFVCTGSTQTVYLPISSYKFQFGTTTLDPTIATGVGFYRRIVASYNDAPFPSVPATIDFDLLELSLFNN